MEKGERVPGAAALAVSRGSGSPEAFKGFAGDAGAFEGLEFFSGSGAADNLAPHCSQKPLAAGFLAPHLGHVFVSGMGGILSLFWESLTAFVEILPPTTEVSEWGRHSWVSKVPKESFRFVVRPFLGQSYASLFGAVGNLSL